MSYSSMGQAHLPITLGGCGMREPSPSSAGRTSGDRWQRQSPTGAPRLYESFRQRAGRVARSLGRSLDTAGRSRRSSSRHDQPLGEESAPALTTRGATRENTESSPNGPRSTPDNGTAPQLRTPGHAAPTRAYESRHKRRRQPMRSPRRHLSPQQPGRTNAARLTRRFHMSVRECHPT